MKSNLIVKKSIFLECVNDTYKHDSDNYVRALYEALMIIYKKRTQGGVCFDDYGGVILL